MSVLLSVRWGSAHPKSITRTEFDIIEIAHTTCKGRLTR